MIEFVFSVGVGVSLSLFFRFMPVVREAWDYWLSSQQKRFSMVSMVVIVNMTGFVLRCAADDCEWHTAYMLTVNILVAILVSYVANQVTFRLAKRLGG